jgi:hypothetical protein
MRVNAALRATDSNTSKLDPINAGVWLFGIPFTNLIFWGSVYLLARWLIR